LAQLADDELEALAALDKTTSDDALGRCSLIGGLAEQLADGPVLPEHHPLPKEIIWTGYELRAKRLVSVGVWVSDT